jgi:hypothetical protein
MSAAVTPACSYASYLVGAAKASAAADKTANAVRVLHPIHHSLIYTLNIPSNGRIFRFESKKAEKMLSFPQ